MEDVDADYFDPFKGPIWDDECDEFDNYLTKLYEGELYKDKGFENIVIKEWQLFTDKQHLRDVIRDYCIQSGFSVVVDKADRLRYTISCSEAKCEWILHASRLPDGVTWAIKKIQNAEHTCLGYGVEMPQPSLYRVRNMALSIIHGRHDTSYSAMPSYCDVIKSTNEGSYANCAWYPPTHPDRPLVFMSIFVSFKASLEGLFSGCRSVIGVDGAHLKGNYGGVLLSAIALDGNNEMFPLAWGIVSCEDEESWKFFIWYLKHVLEPSNRGDNWCIISDRQKGIEKALTDLWPKAQRRYCCRHLSANWKKSFHGPKLWQLFWLACGAFSTFTFAKAMNEIEKNNPDARRWLANLGPQERWTKHKFDPKLKCDVNTTNFVKSFNATLGTDRCKPVLSLLEGIRRVTMVGLATRRQKCEEWERLCPNIAKRVQVLCNESRSCRAFISSPGEYEVVEGKSTLAVSLNQRTCLCNVWQLTGIPCKHAMRAILHEDKWPATEHPTILPLVLKRGVGRPCRNRKRGDDKERKAKRSKTIKCGKCGDFGHNKSSCKGGATKKQKATVTNTNDASTSKCKGKSKAK
ncbi:uncharacterized protein LOC130799342 [Amaranthus tricolor]|uniref:uncharacterized protein LOC130799342 n=1 Tax=Amaranthus tricolor TaxID=29722 RepID=UPI0025882094|nr:uncharacterized protein LOC130799342 [Amaranthus tricolor]